MMGYPSFEDRYLYLRLGGGVGEETFGFARHLNQMFYRSRAWKDVRNYVIDRDNGCDLGVPGFEIHGELLVHHINPITPEDIELGNPDIVDPENLVTTTLRTHNAIHYGDESLLIVAPIERQPGDTRLW